MQDLVADAISLLFMSVLSPTCGPSRPPFPPKNKNKQNMQLQVVESRSWEGMFPRAPSRSGGMIVVQTGVLGTLVAGLAVAVARALEVAGGVLRTLRDIHSCRGYCHAAVDFG